MERAILKAKGATSGVGIREEGTHYLLTFNAYLEAVGFSKWCFQESYCCSCVNNNDDGTYYTYLWKKLTKEKEYLPAPPEEIILNID